LCVNKVTIAHTRNSCIHAIYAIFLNFDYSETADSIQKSVKTSFRSNRRN